MSTEGVTDVKYNWQAIILAATHMRLQNLQGQHPESKIHTQGYSGIQNMEQAEGGSEGGGRQNLTAFRLTDSS